MDKINQDYITDEEEPVSIIRPCERCGTTGPCECIPLMGYCEWLCRKCAAAAYRKGEAV